MMSVTVIFQESKYNYSTSINGTDQEIREYFVGQYLNLGPLGTSEDNMQLCIDVDIIE